MNKIIYDFEVFKGDWLVVFYDYDRKEEIVVINSKDDLQEIYNKYQNDIWIGYNNTNYDQYIFKAILLDISPKKISDLIIIDREYPNSVLPENDIHMFNFDLSSKFRGLKELEGFMGSKIKESDISFDLNRKLTDAELFEVLEYCKHDVRETVKVYENLKQELDSHILMIETFELPMRMFANTKSEMSAHVLGAVKPEKPRNDEFDLSFPNTLILDKYKHVLEWYEDKSNRNYKKKFFTEIAGVPHIFAWGGIHGAIPSYIDVEGGEYIMSDIASMYPALMIEYDYLSRNVKNPEKYREIRDRRIELKKKKDPRQAPLKIVLNGSYGSMKFAKNGLYDPLMANNVCIGGQLLLLDLIEKVEPYCTLIQSNTDGILVKVDSEYNKNKYLELCDEWCNRTRLDLEHDKYVKVIQKDVNNYIIVEEDGGYKSKGAYVKKLNAIDNDLPIVNKALIDYFTKDISVEKTILECNDLIQFQKIVKITNKYKSAFHNNNKLQEKVFRVFASINESDGSIMKFKGGDKYEKISNTPINCFIWNESVNNVECPNDLDKMYYVDIANDRIDKFKNNEFKFKEDSGIKSVNIDVVRFVEENINKYENFIDFFNVLLYNSNKTARNVLILISKFKKFGGIKKLLTFIEYYNKLKKKNYKKEGLSSDLEYYIKPHADLHKTKTTEVLTYKNLDKDTIFRNIWNDLEDEDISFEEKIKYELQFLGYIESPIEKNVSLATINYFSTKNHSVNLKSMRNGKDRWMRFPKQDDIPPKGSIIIIYSMSKKHGYKGRTDWYIDDWVLIK